MSETNPTTSITPNLEQRELVVERVFDAPRRLVWQAWTEPEKLAQWWGPRGWTTTIYELDLRPGGVQRYCMHGPDEMVSCGKTIYREIVEPERLVYLDLFTDAAGNQLKDMPEMLITTRFIEQAGRTTIISSTQFATRADLEAVLAMGVAQGVTETWDRLAELLAAAA